MQEKQKIQAWVGLETFKKCQAIAHKEERSLSKVAAKLIEEGLLAREKMKEAKNA